MKVCPKCKITYIAFSNHECLISKPSTYNLLRKGGNLLPKAYQGTTVNSLENPDRFSSPSNIHCIAPDTQSKADPFRSSTIIRGGINPTPCQNPSASIPKGNLDLILHASRILLAAPQFRSYIAAHTCDESCLLCQIRFLSETFHGRFVHEIYSRLCRIFKKTITICTFIDSVEILLRCFHYLEIQDVSDGRKCSPQCISHNLFGIDMHEKIICQCGRIKEFSWNFCSFIFAISYEDIKDNREGAVFYHNDQRLSLGCTECRGGDSIRERLFLSSRAYILVNIIYENAPEIVSLKNIKMISVQETSSFGLIKYMLISFTATKNDEISIISLEREKWICEDLNINTHSLNNLEILLSRSNYIPSLLVYAKSTESLHQFNNDYRN